MIVNDLRIRNTGTAESVGASLLGLVFRS